MISAHQISSAFIAASFAMPAVALADDYRAEVRLIGNHNEFDDDVGDVDVINAIGTYYLEPVPTDNLPLAEAAFLNRSSHVNVTASHFDQEGEGNAEIFGANIGYYLPDTIFFGRLGVTRVDLGDGADIRWHGSFGVTPIDGLLLTTDFDEDGWDPNVRAKYVGKMGNGHFYAATVSAVDPDEGDVNVGIDFDYFLDLTLKVGAGYNDGPDRFAVRAEKFFTPRFAVAGAVYTEDAGEGFSVQVGWRF